MTNKETIKGYCNISKEYRKLTFEHIPPRCTLNNKKARIYTGDSYVRLLSEKNRYPWEFNGLKYKQLQKGLGGYTLCNKCNNLTGNLYVEEYKKWFYTTLKLINDDLDTYKKAKTAILQLKDVYPGRFIRQVLSIICSTYPGFTKRYPYVKNLILNKDYIYNDKPDFKIYMYLLKNPYNGYSGVSGILSSNEFKIVDEIDLYPFGFCLSLSKSEELEMDITKFINCSYYEFGEVELSTKIHEKNNVVPMDFRTKEEIMNL